MKINEKIFKEALLSVGVGVYKSIKDRYNISTEPLYLKVYFSFKSFLKLVAILKLNNPLRPTNNGRGEGKQMDSCLSSV